MDDDQVYEAIKAYLEDLGFKVSGGQSMTVMVHGRNAYVNVFDTTIGVSIHPDHSNGLAARYKDLSDPGLLEWIYDRLVSQFYIGKLTRS